MLLYVFHAQITYPADAQAAPQLIGWRHVATVQSGAFTGLAALEHAYALTNHIRGAWWNNPGVVWADPARNMRSSSMGDVVLTEVGEAWEVALCGFQPYTPNPAVSSASMPLLEGRLGMAAPAVPTAPTSHPKAEARWFENYLRLAADTPARLRPLDVGRVMAAAAEHDMVIEFRAWLLQHADLIARTRTAVQTWAGH